MLGLSATQIRAYASKGFLQPERGPRGELRFGFHDLVILRTAGELAAAHVPQRKVQRVLQQLRDQLPKGQSLTGIRIAANGNEVVVREGGSSWNPESGQILRDFSVADLAEKTAAIESARSPEVDDMYELACEIESSSPGQAREVYQRLLQLQPERAHRLVDGVLLIHDRAQRRRSVDGVLDAELGRRGQRRGRDHQAGTALAWCPARNFRSRAPDRVLAF